MSKVCVPAFLFLLCISIYTGTPASLFPAQRKSCANFLSKQGLAAICWALWITRNNICFHGKVVISPTVIVCLASSFISYWSDMQLDGDK